MAEIGTAVAVEFAPKVTKPAYSFIGRQLSYVFKYQSHIDKLKEQIKQLGYKTERVEVPVKHAIAQGDCIYEDVDKWLTRVGKFTKAVQPIIGDDSDEDKAKKRCLKGLSHNLTKRYRLGKKAVEAAKECADLLAEGNFPVVSYRLNLQRMESSIFVRDYEPIDSRKSNFQDIMEALKDPNINMIGVYGMGGVGKTTLVKEVAGPALKDKLFDTVVFAEVTQTPNYKQIQEKFARDLGLEFDKETEVQRVDRIRYKLKKEKRLLIILDNIWENFKLEAIGIPFGDILKGSAQRKEEREGINDDQRQCKILLTSRFRNVICKDKAIENPILVNPFSHEDAWHLFMTIVGDCAKESEFHDIAVEIVKKCEGLPVAIVTIAKALKTEQLHAWKDTLDQIGSNPREIEGMDENVCSIIELSYELLKKEEAKLLFLLCGLFNGGSSIYINDLLKYSIGLGWFHNVDSLEKGRNRLYTLIDHLRASYLLLDGIINDTVKMHDIIHAVAQSIASTDKRMSNIQNVGDVKEELEEKIPNDSMAISLHHGDICNELPEKLECPNLKLFFLFMENNSLQIPDHLFEVMKELKVLDLTGFHFLSLPSSLCCLQNLRTLCLDGCLLGDITIIGKLRKLEILSMLQSDIELLPGEIGQLTRLKLLDLRDCSKLKVIAPNVISCLSRLEELYMDNSFIQWGLINNQGQSNANLLELKQLSQLTTLHVHVPNLQVIPQDLFSKKLVSYRILIGDVWDWNWHANYGKTPKMLKIKLNNSTSLIHRVKYLLKSTEELHLELNGFTNSIDELDEDGFAQLKHLHLQNGPELSCVVNIVPSKIVFPKLRSLVLYNMSKLEKICHGQLHVESFSRLRIAKVKKCDTLEHLFAFSMAKNLSQLEEIKVTDCKNLKEIFSKELEEHVYGTERNSKIEFTQLRYLKLKCLPQLKSFGFNTRSREINAEDEPQDFIALFNQKVVFSRLETLKLSVNIEKLWLDQPLEMPSCSQTLRSLTVEKCSGLKFLFSSSMVESLGQLQNLTVCYCDLMEGIINTKTLEEKEMSVMSFSKLSHLRLIGLPKLTSFGTGNLVEFPSLNELYIESCCNLKTFFSNSPNADTVRKEPEEVNLENYLCDVNPLFDEKVAFPSLEIMILLNLDNLRLILHNQLHANSFCKLKVVRVESCEKLMTIVSSNAQGFLTFQNLETLTVTNCRSLKSLFPVPTATGLLQLKELDISSCCLEEIIAAEEVERPPRFVFPQLTYLHLKNLLNLKYFYQGLHTIEWPMLKHLDVYCCQNIKLYASEFPGFQKTDGESQPALFLFEKVMPNLKFLCLDAHNIPLISLGHISTLNFLELKDLELAFFDDESVAFQFDFLQQLYHLESLALLDSSFKELFPYDQGHIWKQDPQVDPFLQNLQILEVWRCHFLKYLMPSSASFKNLTTLDTWRCDGLTNILTCSSAKALVQLRRMRIRECKLVTEIIENEIDRTEEEKIVFWQLKSLEFHCLSSLTYFCSANYTFEFPCLEQVIVSQCLKLKIFSQGVLRTPSLRSVQLSNQKDQEYFWKDDLNSTIQQMLADMVGFRNLEDLKLSEFPTSEKIWNDQVPVDLFCNLKSLVVDEVFGYVKCYSIQCVFLLQKSGNFRNNKL